jgi:hypothetical protein
MPRWVLAVLLLLPFVGVPFFVEWWADRQAERWGEGLSVLAATLDLAEPREREFDRDQVALWRAQLEGSWDEVSPVSTEPSQRSTPRASAPAGLFVSAGRVLALAQQGARPSGIRVPASGARPAGLMLVGVGGLGVGLRDGDILTHALGQPAVSESAVVGAVIQARGARQSRLYGRIWRQGRSFPLVVAQPYLGPG